MNYLTILTIAAVLFSNVSHAKEVEILVPNGWTETEGGIVKGKNELYIGPVLDLSESSPTEHLKELAKVSTEGFDITNIAELVDSGHFVQVIREVIADGSKARSILFICKDGKNKHRLLELFTVDAVSVISGGRAAVQFCNQS